MKIRKLLFFSISVCIFITITSWKRSTSGCYYIGGAAVPICYSNGLLLSIGMPEWVPLMKEAIREMSPQQYVSNVSNTPSLVMGWEIAGVNWQPIPGDYVTSFGLIYDNTTSEDMLTYTTVSWGGIIEFDIYVNQASDVFANAQFGNGYPKNYGLIQTVDMMTRLKHELGHGIGLGHTKYSSGLMYSPINPGPTSIRSIGQDEKNGYSCLYDGLSCDTDDNACANIEISTNLIPLNGSITLSWNIETESERKITGFNILKRGHGSSIYKSLNNTMIKYNSVKGDYYYSIGQSNTKEDSEYYIEVVYNNSFSNIIKFTKSNYQNHLIVIK